MASLSDSAVLEQLKLARDALIAGIVNGQSIVEYQVMNQRKRVSDPIAALKEVQEQIAHYEARVAATTAPAAGSSSGSNTGSRGRNYFEIHRR